MTDRFFPQIVNRTISNKLRIGVHRRGGIGDALLGSCAIAGIRRKYPDGHIIAFCEGSIHEIWKNNPHLNEVIKTPPHLCSEHQIRQYYRQAADLWFDLKPCSRVIRNTGRVIDYNLDALSKKWEPLDKGYILSSPALLTYNKEALDLTNEMLGIDSSIADMYIGISESAKAYAQELAGAKNMQQYIIQEEQHVIHEDCL